MGTHLRALSEIFPMNTNMKGFTCFSKIFESLCFGRFRFFYWPQQLVLKRLSVAEILLIAHNILCCQTKKYHYSSFFFENSIKKNFKFLVSQVEKFRQRKTLEMARVCSDNCGKYRKVHVRTIVENTERYMFRQS